jgi:S1-C subfamily serine protease
MHEPLEPAPQFSEVGLPVVYCLPGSAAFCSGIRRGDVIVEVNGVPITDAHAYLRACRLSSADMLLKVKRAGKMIELSVPLKPLPDIHVNVAELYEC